MLIYLPASERFHFESPIKPSWCWSLIVALVLNFAVVIGVGVALWRFFHG